MFTRRAFVESLAVASTGGLFLPAIVRAQSSAFDVLYSSAISNEGLIDGARGVREGLAFEEASRAVAPRRPPSSRKVSQRAIDLIVLFEVSSKARYERIFQQAVRPGGESGVTIGIGYDLGYVTKAFFREDWQGILTEAELNALDGACGLKGAAAQAALPRFRNVSIPWSKAEMSFRERVLPRYTAEALAGLAPGRAVDLSDDSLGALVSLVYNRGAPFRNERPRFREMRSIRQDVVTFTDPSLARIPQHIRDMKRLWAGKPNLAGLAMRRDLEAALFQEGLA